MTDLTSRTALVTGASRGALGDRRYCSGRRRLETLIYREVKVKLYQSNASPNSRRVRIFLAEKSISMPLVPVDLGAKEQFSDAYAAINPRRVVPTLVLDDGTAIGEVPAILRYLVARAAAIRDDAEDQGAGHDVGATRRTGRICIRDGSCAQRRPRSQEPRHCRTA